MHALQGDACHGAVREGPVVELVAGLERERVVAAVGGAVVGLDRDADRNGAVHVIVLAAGAADDIGPVGAVEIGGIDAGREGVLGEIAGGAEGLLGGADRERRAHEPAVRELEVEAGGGGDRVTRIAGEVLVVVHLEERKIAGHPGAVAAGGPILRERDLVEDGVDGLGAGLHRHLGEERDLARRDDEAVIVVGLDLLARRGHVLIVGEQAGVLRIGRDEMRGRRRIGRAQQRPGGGHPGRPGAGDLVHPGADELKAELGGVIGDRDAHRVPVGRDEADAVPRQSRPEGLAVVEPRLPLGCTAGAGRKRERQVWNDDVAGARGLQLRDRTSEAVGRADQIRGRVGRRGGADRVGDVVTARADQIERVGVGASAGGGEVVVDLGDGRDRLREAAGHAVVDGHVLGAAGGVVGAAGLVGGDGGQAEHAGERLRVHRPGAGGRLARAGGDGGWPQQIVGGASTRVGQRPVVAAVDGAVAEADELIERLRGRRIGDRDNGNDQQNGASGDGRRAHDSPPPS